MTGLWVLPLIGAEAHAIRVVRVVVVVRIAAGVDIVEVVRIVAIRTALPPVRDGTGALLEINRCYALAGVFFRLCFVVLRTVQRHVPGVVQVAFEGIFFLKA